MYINIHTTDIYIYIHIPCRICRYHIHISFLYIHFPYMCVCMHICIYMCVYIHGGGEREKETLNKSGLKLAVHPNTALSS